MYQAHPARAPDAVREHRRGAGPRGVRSFAPEDPSTRSARPAPADREQQAPELPAGIPAGTLTGTLTGRYGAPVHTGDAPSLPAAGDGDQPAARVGRPADDSSPSIQELVAAALEGDQAAWQQIVDRHAGLVWSVVRGFRLGEAESSDVAQTVWLRLVENLPRIHQPAALPGWLATTARRECIRALRRAQREVPTESALDAEGEAPDEDSPEWHLLADERQRAVWRAVSTLARRCQLLLRALAYDAGHSYAEISAALDMPVGSIGPTRSRCLQQLRRALEPDGYGPHVGNGGGASR